MKVLALAVLTSVACASLAQAQFAIPLPKPVDPDLVRIENLRLAFLAEREDNGQYRRSTEQLRIDASTLSIDDFAKATEAFCSRLKVAKVDCDAALARDSMKTYLQSRDSGVRRLRIVHLKSRIPTRGYNRGELGAYMRQSGAEESFSLASQFAANISNKEAYVVSNIVRGITGRLIFSADYALVVTKSDSTNPAKRDTIEGDRANLLRAINNGGTLVARFVAPMYASSGSNFTTAAGLAFSGGLIGPIDETPEQKQRAAISGVGEWLGSLAIRSLAGDGKLEAELVVGARAGITVSDAPLRIGGEHRSVSYAQAVLGLRQNGNMSLSALFTVANNQFNSLVPRAVLSFSAVR